MNNQLIEKVITSSNQTCPKFSYNNPLLGRNVAKALARSFVKILKLSKQNSNINNNLRISILENIRKLCQLEPETHLKVDENVTKLLTEFYEQYVKLNTSNAVDSVDRTLDAFLVRRMKEFNVCPSYNSSVNPEIVQALINLNENSLNLDALSKDIIHWNTATGRCLAVINDLWMNSNILETPNKCTMLDDISIKMKSEIERLLLGVCHNILENRDDNIEDMLQSNVELNNLVHKCSISGQCFQICTGILNSLFIMTNFDLRIQSFVTIFVAQVKKTCKLLSISALYPMHVSHIVVLLDFDINVLPMQLKHQYMQPGLKYLHQLHSESDNALILLLSHYPQWFDIYFEQRKSC